MKYYVFLGLKGDDIVLKSKKIMALVAAFVLVVGSLYAVSGQINVTIQSESVATSSEDSREFTVEHSIDVTYQQVVGEPEIVLVLDRSNSMLEEGFDGLPVAQTVWDSVNDFLHEYYTEYPTGQVAIVSFGTNAVKNDNWKYYDNLTDALNEVSNIYGYSYGMEAVYEYIWQNNHWLKNFVGYEQVFYWLNWNHENGGTNIKEGFEYAETTIWKKDDQRTPAEMMPNSVVLFSDGVATHGGINSEEDLLYPTVHNSNTLSAIAASETLSNVANVVTVGYFEGVSNPDVVVVARDTLTKSNNGGFFEAGNLSEIDPVFDAALDAVKYVGSLAVVKEVVAPEFEVVPGSIYPAENYTLTMNEYGETVLEWDIGSLKPEMYDFSYKIQVRGDAYPTGKEKVNVNSYTALIYENLQGELVETLLDKIYVDVWPLAGMPYITMNIIQEGSIAGGYLTGDLVKLVHDLDYVNSELFMFDQVLVDDLFKNQLSGQMNDFVLVSEEWILGSNSYEVGIDEDIRDSQYGDYLDWTYRQELILEAVKPGEYLFDHDLDYVQIDEYNQVFDGFFEKNEDFVSVKESHVLFNVIDTMNNRLSDFEVFVDTEPYNRIVSEDNGASSIYGLSTGDYAVGVKVPSGYSYTGAQPISKGIINHDLRLDYGNPDEVVNISLNLLDVKDVSVKALSGEDYVLINNRNEAVNAVVEFTTLANLDYLNLILQDDFNADHSLDTSFTLSSVVDVNGQAVSGFTFENSSGHLEYNKGDSAIELPAGKYRAVGTFEVPSAMQNTNDSTFVNVDSLQYKSPVEVERTQADNIYSPGLLIQLDEEAPIITETHSLEVVPGESKDVDLDIEDIQSNLDSYYVLKGKFNTEEEVLTEVTRLGLSSGGGMKDIEVINGKHIVSLFNVSPQIDFEGSGFHIGSGLYTIYAKDIAGNVAIKVISIQVISEFPDNI